MGDWLALIAAMREMDMVKQAEILKRYQAGDAPDLGLFIHFVPARNSFVEALQRVDPEPGEWVFSLDNITVEDVDKFLFYARENKFAELIELMQRYTKTPLGKLDKLPVGRWVAIRDGFAGALMKIGKN